MSPIVDATSHMTSSIDLRTRGDDDDDADASAPVSTRTGTTIAFVAAVDSTSSFGTKDAVIDDAVACRRRPSSHWIW
jgi:hypothetical protein